MDVGHDTEQSLGSVVDLVNTAPAIAGEELLPDLLALDGFVRRRQVSGVGPLTAADIAAVHDLRRVLHEVFLTSDDATATALVNDLVAGGGTTPRLTQHGGWPLHIHYFAPGARLSEHLAADCGMALALVLVAGERERLRSCEAPGCERVLVDLTRNRSRRYCDSRTCGNRQHVAAYRARQRGA